MFRVTHRDIALITVLMVVVCCFPSSAISQGVEPWSNLGLYGGQIYDIAIDAANPDKMFVGSYMGDGLFVTTDGGSTWQAVETDNEPEGEGTFKNHVVYAVEIAPSDHNVIWVAHNYWIEKSIDGGETWSHIRNDIMQRDCQNCGGEADRWRFCESLAVDPVNPNIVYVGTGGPENTASPGAVYKTEDGGTTWTKMNQGGDFDHSVVDMDIDSQNSSIIWAVTNSFGYGGWVGTVYRSQDGGETWIEVFTMPGAFYEVEVKPDDSNMIFTGNAYGIFKHYFDEGEWKYEWILNYWGQWPPPPNEVFARMVQAFAFDPQHPNVLHAAWQNPYGDTRPKVARGTTPFADADWEIHTSPHQFLALAVHPTNSERIYGGSLNLGMYESEDHGQTWTEINNGINAVVVFDVAVDPDDSTHMFVGTVSGIFEKEGDTWSRKLPYETRSIRFHPTNSTILYAGFWGCLGKSTDAGENWWFTCYLPGPVWDIAVDAGATTDTDTVYIAVGEEVQKSVDGGATFTKVLNGQNQSGEAYHFNVVTIDPSNPQHIFAGGGNFYTPMVVGDLWESEDGGTNWTRTGLQNVIVNALLIDPQNPDVLYAGCGYSGGTDVPLYKSTNGGETWQASYEDISGMDINLKGVWGTSATDVFAVSDYVVGFGESQFLHYDGSAWSVVNGIQGEALQGLWGSSSENIFAAGISGAVFHYDGNIWSAMTSGTTENLYGVWGSSDADVFAVGDDGTILHYDGNDTKTWEPMISGTTESLEGVWGSSGANVFAVGDSGGIVCYDGNLWAISRSPGSVGNAVTDLEFHPQDTNIVYAGTFGAGVFVSPNQAGNWLNLGTPDYKVFAISTGSLYAATQGGLLQCTGTGVIAGQVANAISHIGIHMANVSNDFGVRTISISGQYMMVSPSGICDVTATANRYLDETVAGVTVYGGDVTWANIWMPPDSCVVEITPHHHAGINDNAFIANDASFAVHIEDPDGIDITDPASIRLTINDGTTAYTRDLSHPSVTYKKMVSTEGDTHVTKVRVLYDRSKDNAVGNYAFGSTVHVSVDVKGITQQTSRFRVGSEQEHNHAQSQRPTVTSVGPELGVFDQQAGQDTGIQVTSGPLKGAMLVYSGDELVEPSFGPVDALPTLSGGVGVPMNLEPTNWSFDVPVKVYIPCPGYVDVSELCIYFYSGTSWVYACDAAGNVQPAAERWMVRDSRKNNNNGDPSTIEIQVYHFSGVQASASAPPTPFTEPSADPTSGGGGGGCFISTAAWGFD